MSPGAEDVKLFLLIKFICLTLFQKQKYTFSVSHAYSAYSGPFGMIFYAAPAVHAEVERFITTREGITKAAPAYAA
jgi:hypothetical protein